MMLKKLLATTALVAFATTSTFGIAQAAEVEGPEVKWNLSRCGATSAPSPPDLKNSEVVEAKTDGKFTVDHPLRRSLVQGPRKPGRPFGRRVRSCHDLQLLPPEEEPGADGSHHAVPADGQLG
jgi:hypothetical protein